VWLVALICFRFYLLGLSLVVISTLFLDHVGYKYVVSGSCCNYDTTPLLCNEMISLLKVGAIAVRLRDFRGTSGEQADLLVMTCTSGF
jgi:hypothetical protein